MGRFSASRRHGYGARHEGEGAGGEVQAGGFDEGVELEFWRERFGERPYARAWSFEDYRPAFAYALRVYPAAPGRSFEDLEGALADGWHWHRAESPLAWGEARPAVRDAWRRMVELGKRRASLFEATEGDLLNGVIRALHDRRLGFQQAALEVDSEELRAVCVDFAAESRRFIQLLSGFVTGCGERPAGSGTVLGSLGRGWSTLRRASGAGDGAVLSACVQGEDETAGVYAAALRSVDLGAEHRRVLLLQLLRVQLCSAELRGRRDAL